MAKERRLTVLQKKYCEARAKGMGYAEAYREAGYSTKCSSKNQSRDAYHMEYSSPSSDMIKAEIKRLQAQVDEKALLDRMQRQALLTEIALNKEEKTDNRLRAADMLNRMSGDYTDNVRTTVAGGVELTYEERRKLIEDALNEE